MKGSAYTVAFSLALGIASALLLSGVGAFTAPYRAANARAEEVRNILAVLGVPLPATAGAADVLKAFEASVGEEEGRGVRRYVYREEGRVKRVAVPFAGPGLWGPIKGLLALEPDLRTIAGITFYEQEETPGLGGEIDSESFRDQFRGKSILRPDGTPGIRILRGDKATGPNDVDGITGATMTCNKVEIMINRTIADVAREGKGDGQ